MVKEQAAISASDDTARGGYEAQNVTPFSGAFPFSAFERAVVGKDDAEGEVARRGTGLQRVMQCEKLEPPGALVDGWQCRAIDIQAVALRHPLEAGSSGEPQGAAGVTGDREGRDGRARHLVHAQAQAR